MESRIWSLFATHLFKLLKNCQAIGVSLAILVSASVSAVEIQANANVTITSAVSLTEIQPVSFGSVARGSGVCHLNSEGHISGDALCAGNGSTGLLEIRGEEGSRVSISASPGAADSITFIPEILGASDSHLLPDGSVQLPVGGSITLDAPEAGSHLIQFEVIANYE